MHYHGHRERLRKRLQNAPELLADYEILELLLGYVIQRRDTKPIAKELLERFTSLRGVMDARPEEYLDMPGVGTGVTQYVCLLREFLARYAEGRLRNREALCSPEEVAHMARQRLGRLPHEEVWVAFMDNRLRLISWERAAKGSVNNSTVYPRDIMERALALKAAGFIVVHNHPGGNASPSGIDLEFTRQLERAAQALSINFWDHVIVSDSESYSLMNKGML